MWSFRLRRLPDAEEPLGTGTDTGDPPAVWPPADGDPPAVRPPADGDPPRSS